MSLKQKLVQLAKANYESDLIAVPIQSMFVLKTLISPICKVRILVSPWPDLPGCMHGSPGISQ